MGSLTSRQIAAGVLGNEGRPPARLGGEGDVLSALFIACITLANTRQGREHEKQLINLMAFAEARLMQ